MNLDILDELIDNAKHLIFRYEALQDYSAEDGIEMANEFVKTGDIGFEIEGNEFYEFLKAKQKAGCELYRIRNVELPMNNYTKWEIEVYRKMYLNNHKKVGLIHYREEPTISNIQDFYIIDNQILLLDYGDNGKLLDCRLADDDNYMNIMKTLIDSSIDLKDYNF